MANKYTYIATSIALALAGATGVSGAASGGATALQPSNAGNAALSAGRADLAQQGEDRAIAVFVTLEGTPASVEYARAIARSGDTLLGRTAAGTQSRAAVAANEIEQSRFATTLANSGIRATELYRVSRVLNGFALNVSSYDDLARLKALPGVVAVRPLPLHEPSNASSVAFINAPKLWEGTPLNSAGYKGEGIRIGIIDSGIDYQHPMFGGTGLLADYQANNRTLITDLINGSVAFPTAKVFGGTDLAGDAYNAAAQATATPAPDPDPMDCGGHGTHVAGTAAGYGVKADGTPYNGPWDTTTDFSGLRIGAGVAPRAELFAIRVFGCSGSTALTVAGFERAQDPNDDGDLSDRLDVANLSLGSAFGQPDDDSATAADNAASTGMIVVISAGNNGDTHFVLGSPSSAKNAISVANTMDDGVGGPVRGDAPAAVAGLKVTGAANFGVAPPPAGLTLPVVAVDDGSTATVPPGSAGGTPQDGCSTPFLNAAAVAGKIAFIDRGACPFKLKVYNAQLNGAAGVIIGNVASSGNPNAVIGMADDATIPAVTIPSSLIALPDANAFRANLAAGVTATLTNGADTVNASTSRGPSGAPGQQSLKPDISAPGTNIVSAQSGIICTANATGCVAFDPSGYLASGRPLSLSGTSMAAPHMSGYAALLRQQNPGASVAEIKAIAMNSASHDLFFGPAGTLDRYAGGRIGSGRADVAHAVSPILALNDANPEQVSLSFDDTVVGTADVTKNIRLENRTALAQSVTLALDTLNDSPGVAFALTGPTTVTVPPAGSVIVPVRMTATATDMKRHRDPTVSATQVGASAGAAALGPLPRYYLDEESANLIVSKAGNEVARVPVYMAHRPHSDLSATVGPGPNLQLNVAGTGVCTGTLAGSSCDAASGVDHQSLVSALELQYTGTRNEELPGYFDVQHLGVTYGADRFVFGISTFGAKATPNNMAFNVCVDTNEDGNYDRVLFATSVTGYFSVAGQANDPMDVFVTGMFTPPTSLNIVGFTNLVSPDQIDIGTFNSNSLLISATAANLGLAAGDRSLRYAVAVCPSFNPLCVRLNPANQCGSSVSAYATVPGPFTFDGNAPGVTVNVAGGGPAALLFEQNGTQINGTYNPANMAANGSSGVLLLHHTNLPENAAQVIQPDRIFADDFEN
jgi:subtilisin family serine protease